MRTGLDYLSDRLRERSTWSVIVTLILGFFGINQAPSESNLIWTAVIGALSAIGIITKEEKE